MKKQKVSTNTYVNTKFKKLQRLMNIFFFCNQTQTIYKISDIFIFEYNVFFFIVYENIQRESLYLSRLISVYT